MAPEVLKRTPEIRARPHPGLLDVRFHTPSPHRTSASPYSACFWDRVRVMRGLGARSATFCHYNRRRVRIGSAPREASGPDGPSEHAGGASQRSASAGPTLLRIWEY